MIKLLLVEDDDILGFMLKDGMELIGDYEVLWCNNPKDGLVAFDTFNPDILVSDVEMPGMTGLEMVRRIREKNLHIPVILETGVSSGKTIVEAYEIGIDNYIKKPFLPAELHAYIQGLMRRMASNPSVSNSSNDAKPISNPEELVLGSYLFNPKRQTLISPSRKIELSVAEALLLEQFVKNIGTLVTKEMIAEHVWGGKNFMNYQSLDVFLHNLRKYLAEDTKIILKTVRGVGYVLEVVG
jgi:DNA-binding response OmpR family regulator